MPVKNYKPTSAGRRNMSVSDFAEVTRGKPERALVGGRVNKSGGRNSNGRITSWHRGGGHKRRYRKIDFKRDKIGVPAKVAAIEYDPNRSANIALLHYRDGEKRYIIAPSRVSTSAIRGACRVPKQKFRPGQLRCRSANDSSRHCRARHRDEGRARAPSWFAPPGLGAQLMAREGRKYAQLRMPSGEHRKIFVQCIATIGEVGNSEHENRSIGKAGRSRWLGKRGNTRGVAMNPVDHPMGGGEGRSSGGRHPCTPWGVPTKGHKTRKNPRTDKYIVKRRGRSRWRVR